MEVRKISTGQRLRKARRTLGLRPKQVKRALALNSISLISRWENNVQEPSLTHAIGLSRLYKTSIYELFPDIDRQALENIAAWMLEAEQKIEKPTE